MYCIDPTADEPIMLINKHIGFDEKDGQGVDGSLFQEELLQLDRMGKKRIQIWINSPGGTVMDGYNIVNAILKSVTKVDTYCVGIAASIAAVIFQQGRNRIMADYGLLMYHNPYGGNGGDELDAMRNSIVTMIATRTGKPSQDIKRVMDKTTWIEADEAYKNGFCDTVEVSVDLNKKRQLIGAGDAKAMYLQGNAVLNSILNDKNLIKPNTMSFKLVTNKLGLNESATEDNILRAIQDIENKAATESATLNTALNEAKRLRTDAENKARDLESQMNAAKEKYDALKAEFDKLKKEKEETEAKAAKDKAEATETEAKNMLNGFVKANRIKADAVDGWLNKVKENKLTVAEVKDMIEALPLNGKAARVAESVSGADTEKNLTSVVAQKMAEVRNRVEERGKN
jgi:ATP-dependent Clp protease protease subunit